MTTVLLRDGEPVRDPVGVAAGFLEAYGVDEAAAADGFDELDLGRANRGGARISAEQIAAVLERRARIEVALAAIPASASLAQRTVAWAPLTELFDAFGELRGIGLAKVTKALHPKRPALIPILDSLVQRYLESDEPVKLPFAERATVLVRRYKQDVDRNLPALREAQATLARRGYRLTEVRLLDLLIWSAKAPASAREGGAPA